MEMLEREFYKVVFRGFMKYINDIYTDKAFHWLQFLKHNNLGFLKKGVFKFTTS